MAVNEVHRRNTVFKNTRTDVDSVLEINPIGKKLISLLRRFELVDGLTYSEIAKALFEAYGMGLKDSIETIKPAFSKEN